ncbi:CHAT domain-containing protein [Anabaena sphaerica FACHB-251]|uniref:CHAT domain-containing protein n=1 Tax=Anabaena sphaerica FACHB-251 TaxID=2692883 RepID=A0A927A1C6_9NOST|nr:CHAT domain-containing tetratricopeptide repeat protein [Anabaena sphaerica]MBD2294484.1 CHAT domain-containing protein [Anabaena sphaerica FACHB-251]
MIFNTTLLVFFNLLPLPIMAQGSNYNLIKNNKLDEQEEENSFKITPEICEMNAQALEMLPPEVSRYFKDFCDAGKKGGVTENQDILNIFTGVKNERTLENYFQGLEAARKSGNSVQERQLLSIIALGYANKLHFNKALEFYEQALIVNRKNNDPQVEAETLNQIARLYARNRQELQALKYLEQSLAITQGKKDKKNRILRLRLDTLKLMGLIYQYQNQKNQALKIYEEAISIVKGGLIDRQTQGLTLREIGRFYQISGDYAPALSLYKEVLEIGKNDSYVRLLGFKSLGDLYELQNNYAQALEFYEQAVKLTKNDNLDLYLGSSLADVGRIYNRLGRHQEAEKLLIQSVQQAESQYKLTPDDIPENGSSILGNVSSFVDQFTPMLQETEKNSYQELQRSLIAQNKNNAALEISERGRARAFSQLLAINLALSGKRDIAVKNDIINIEQMKQIAQKQKATLVQYSILKKPIQNGVLEYGIDIPNPKAQDDLQLLIWVIKPTGEIAFRQVDLKSINNSLETLVKNSRNAIIRVGTSKKATETSLKELHQLLISPIAEHLPTNPNDRVIFIPDGSLFLVPFVALQDAQGKYLIEKHTILTSPAIRVLDLVHQQRQKVSGKGALVVGNPKMPDYSGKLGEKPQPLSDLPNAELEAQAIAKLLNTQAIIGNNATKQAIVQQMPNARIIHFATHGLLDHYEGLGSAIAFAPSAKDDGFLTAQELVEMKLNAELVVLSACDTGRGVITGDGVIGLSRSFFAAGVPSIVVSLWAVPDAPTSILMTEFYQILQTQPDKAQALRQAMLNTMKKHPAPQNWAAFTLVGEAL